MSFKIGDLVRLTKDGIGQSGHWFKDGVYEGLEVKRVGNDNLQLLQSDKIHSWYVSITHCELMPSDDPKTWKRNKPIMIRRRSGNYVPAHFSHHDDGRVYVYRYGKSSFTVNKNSNKTMPTTQWKLPTKEELA